LPIIQALPKKVRNLFSSSQHPYLFITFLLISGFAWYYRTLFIGFIFDDIIYLHFLKSKVLNPLSIFFFNKIGFYRPLTFSTWYLDFRIWGENGIAFHFMNIIFHITNTLLLYILTQKTVPQKPIPLISAILFLISPFAVEPVSWLCCRFELLSTTFFLLAILWYHTHLHTGKIRFYLFAAFSYLLALLNKEMAATLPLILFFWGWTLSNIKNRQNLKKILPFLFIFLSYFSWRYHLLEGIGGYSNSISINKAKIALILEHLFRKAPEIILMPIQSGPHTSLYKMVILILFCCSACLFLISLSNKKIPAKTRIKTFMLYLFAAFVSLWPKKPRIGISILSVCMTHIPYSEARQSSEPET